jgi:hypothetical protein
MLPCQKAFASLKKRIFTQIHQIREADVGYRDGRKLIDDSGS